MSVIGAPWQFDWKRPLFQQVQGKAEENTDSLRPAVVAHVAAAVRGSEIGKNEDCAPLMLTVTLSSSSQDDLSSSSIADVVTLELIRQGSAEGDETTTATPECVQMRTLRWPTVEVETTTTTTAASSSSDEDRLDVHKSRREFITCFPASPRKHGDDEDQGDEEDSMKLPPCFLNLTKNPLLSLFVRSPKTKRKKTTRRRRNGLISAALVRLPHPSGQAGDATDFLNLLTMASSEDKGVPPAATTTDTPEEDPTELVLACLTSDNMVHFYSVWTLLLQQHSDAAERKNVYEEGMASFVFGSSLLSTLQDTVLPLSQPDHSVRLSVPFLQAARSSSSTEARQDESNQVEKRKQQDERKQPVGVLSLLDASSWDPTIEASTLAFQTKNNVPTHCVAALEYLCIAGRGRQRWKKQAAAAAAAAASEQHVSEGTTATSSAKEGIQASLDEQTSSSLAAVNRRSLQDNGGFVTFISLRTFSEKRTLFLPFVPSHISPFKWGAMAFLLVVGQGNAVAIRMDASEVFSIPRGESPADLGNNKSVKESPTESNPQPEEKMEVSIQRFQILPIVLSENESPDRIVLAGSDTLVEPPGIAILAKDALGAVLTLRLLSAIDITPEQEIVSLFAQYHPNTSDGKRAVITTIQDQGKVAQINASIDDSTSLGCRLGQGWCLVSAGSEIDFVCLEGANSERRAYVYKLAEDEIQTTGFANCIMSDVLSVDPFTRVHPNMTSSHDFDLRLTESASRIGDGSGSESVLNEESGELDDIVVEAMESISSLSYRDMITAKMSPRSSRAQYSKFTNREKSRRLLRHCSSWTRLDNSTVTRPRFASQTPALSVRLPSKYKNRYVLSLRRASVENGAATPFQQVLAWLSDQKDYFTAASLALDLLRDAESLRHLWRAFDKIDDESERSKLEGLLDGITPIHCNKDGETVLHAKMTQLADMTVGLLTKGGYAMSSTLEQFLGRNLDYDPSRASLMLVATVASALSDDEDLVASVMGKDYKRGKGHSERIMWPVRCLLKVGSARDHLRTALLLLNTTIPDELRRRQRGGVASTSVPSMEMCKSLVTLIVGISQEAIEILLDFVDEKTRFRFWQSLEHDTRLELSLVSVNQKSPMLRDAEVRSWAIAELQKCIEFEDSASSAIFLPTSWLETLVLACLKNAGCNVDNLIAPAVEETKHDLEDEDGLIQHSAEVKRTRESLMPAPASGGLDFDLLIPALLVLVHRDVLWYSGSKTPTRALLNAVCYLAGRPSVEEPLFAMNSAALMQQCTLAGDVEAGANLIGGKNGLTLECCHVLIEEVGMDMDEAEKFLLSDPEEAFSSGRVGESKSFEIRSCHRRILWLLEEHVLRIRTYGEFETTHSRGKVDPVFAATLCFRTWWIITRQHLQDATDWLQRWLCRQLLITEKTAVSPQRLACAALVRALIWPCNKEDVTQGALLASKLQLDGVFLVQLTQSCCGLVEALPNFVFEGNRSMASEFTVRGEGSSSSPRKERSVDHNQSANESFVSAAASLRDLDTSWMDL